MKTNHRIDWDSAECVTYSTDYYQRITLESWFTNLEHTPLSRCQQLLLPTVSNPPSALSWKARKRMRLSVSKEPDGYLTTSVYRKPTHTDQYLAYDSHHPQSVKRSIVKCLYNRAKRLVTNPSVISEEKKHLSFVLFSNGYPSSFVQKLTRTRKAAPRVEPETEFKSTAVLTYIKVVSEPLRAVFKSDTTLRSHLVRPKDTVDPPKQDGVVYRIPCECGKVYIGEKGRSVQERIKEHDRDVRLAHTQTSVVSEHANKTGHHPRWNEVKFIDQDSHWNTRRVKEAIHIRLHPDNINRDNGIKIPEAWIPTIKKHDRRPVHQRTAEGTTSNRTSRETTSQQNNEDRNAPITADHRDSYGDVQPVDPIA